MTEIVSERPELTQRQAETLAFIVWYINQKGYPPTIAEIAEGIDVASTSTAFTHVQGLVQKGRIEVDGSARALRVVE